MDWTVVSGITGGMKRYKEAYKAGRMDLVAAEEKQIEQGFKMLESGTNVQAARQTMGLRESEEQRTEQMFPGKLAQQGATLAATEEGTRATAAGAAINEQQFSLVEQARQEELKTRSMVEDYLKSKGYSITSPLAMKMIDEAMVSGEGIDEKIIRAEKGFSKIKIAREIKEEVSKGVAADVAVETGEAQLGFGAERKEVVGAELAAGKEMPGVELTMKKSQALESGSRTDLMKKQIEGLSQQIEIGNLMKDVNKRYVESQINANNLKAEASEANKIDIGNARHAIYQSLVEAGKMDTGEAMTLAGSLPPPTTLITQIKFALDSKYRLNDVDINEMGAMMAKSGFEGAKKPTNDAELVKARTAMSEEFDKQIALLKYQLNLWGIDYSEPYDIEQATKPTDLDNEVNSIFGGE